MGGQGVITLAYILGQACLFDGKYAAQTQSYGPEARGSICRSEVVIGDEPIDYPWIVQPDILLAMSQDAYDQYHTNIKRDGCIIVDPILVKHVNPRPLITVYTIQATETATNVVGSPIAANVVMFGALTTITRLITEEAAQKSIVKRWPKYANLNIKAFHEGLALGEKALVHAGSSNPD
jgi:2-oxoglutarate ferredoxin oxidoreductase subunit gamma